MLLYLAASALMLNFAARLEVDPVVIMIVAGDDVVLTETENRAVVFESY